MDIPSWLQSLGLGQYAELFLSNDIDGKLVRQLTGDDLKELGITSLGHRKKLLEAIAALANTNPSTTARSSSTRASADVTDSGAERRQLTVMFVDLVGSTALSAQLDPEDMSELIRTYQNTVAGEISRFEGHIAQFLGDGVLAYFGWPRAHEDDAERAVRAGLAVTAAASRLSTPASKSLQTRTGIATGMVVVGDLIGEGAGQRHAVVGETPNFAARLQAIAEPGMVVIADSTRHLAGDLFVLRDLGAQTFKGISEPAKVFAVLSERTVESRFAARHEGKVSAIVGRDQELALLVERWRQAKTGEGQVVLLNGEAGVGKSRIAEAVVEAALAEPHFLLRFQCSPYHTESALYPMTHQLTRAAGLADDDTPDQRLDRLESLLSAATDDISDVAPFFAALLGLDSTPRYGASTLTPQQRRNRTLAALISQLEGLASRKPVLWIFEDAHWIDPTTLELIELALDRVQQSRVLMLITSRPTFVATFGSHPVVTRLALNRVGRAATQAIVTRIARGKRFPEVLLDEISAKTDGIPLFVEEMTKAVIESGVLREDKDAYYLDGPLSGLAIPTTLHDSLMARLDRLQPVKEVAQAAAVIGRHFDHRTIAALSDKTEDELASAIRQLVDAELIFRRGAPPDATYLFKHALVCDAAYESLLKSKRAALHARLVQVLESQENAPATLKAQHAEAAGMTERALGYWEFAGAQSLARPAYKEAIANLENAVRLCRTMGDVPHWKRRELGLWLQKGQALIANQGYQASATREAFEAARVLADAIDDPGSQLQALYGQWVYFYVGGIAKPELASRYDALAETQSDSGLRLVGLRMLCLERFHEGRFTESLTLVRESLKAYDPVAHRGDNRFGHDARTGAISYEAWLLWHLGFPDQAAQRCEDNLQWTRQVNHANTTGFCLCYGIDLANIWLRRPDRVETLAREALHLATEMSLMLWHAWAQIHLGWALSQLAKDTGLSMIEAGLKECREIGAGRMEPLHLSLAAQAYARAGRLDHAKACIAKAFAALEHGHDMALAAELYRLRASLTPRKDSSDRRAVETDLRRAFEIASTQRALSLQLRAARDLAALLGEDGDKQRAIDLLAPIYDEFTEGFKTQDLVESKVLLDRLRT